MTYGPTLPGYTVSTDPGEEANPLRVSYRNLYVDQFKPRGFLEVEVYLSTNDGTFHAWEARWLPPSADWEAIWIQLYDGPRVAVQARKFRARWPLGHSGVPYVLQARMVTNPVPWSLMIVPIAAYSIVPAFQASYVGQIEPECSSEF